MQGEDIIAELLGQNILYLLLAVFIIVCIMAGVRIVPQSEYGSCTFFIVEFPNPMIVLAVRYTR